MSSKHFDKIEDIWPIFRVRIKSLQYKSNDSTFGNDNNGSYVRNVLSALFVGFKNILKFKQYKTWIFTSSSDLFKADNKLVDCVTSGYLDNINDSLLIIRPHSKFDSKKIWTKRILSESLLILISFCLVYLFKLINKKVPLENELKTKAKEIDYKIYYYRFWAEYLVFNKIIKCFQVERIFVNCSYSYFGYIYACKKNNVQVIEIQHGLINESHDNYIYKTSQNPDLFPNEIYVFGNNIKDLLLKHSSLYQAHQIKIIGSNALNLYGKINYTPDEHIRLLRNKYDKIVLFTGQFTVDKQSLQLVDDMQKESKDICFLFLARKKNEIREYKKLFKNVIFYEGDNKFYSLVKQVDFHATVYSTTFLESLSLGVPNILFNVENYSIEHYKEVVNKNYPFILCSTQTEEILSFIENITEFDKEEIAKSVDIYFAGNFVDNLNYHENN